jgi:hypothetical protein
MVEFLEYLKEVSHVPRNSVERGDNYDIKAMPTGICQKLV